MMRLVVVVILLFTSVVTRGRRLPFEDFESAINASKEITRDIFNGKLFMNSLFSSSDSIINDLEKSP